MATQGTLQRRLGLANAPEQRRWPRWIAAAGLVGCVVLALSLPWRELLAGAGVLLVGALVRVATAGRAGAN